LSLGFLALFCVALRAADGSQLEANPTLFTVMSAVLAGQPEATGDPLRDAVRQHVAAKNPAVLPELRTFFYEHRKADPAANLAQYVSFALVHDDPPRFKPLLFGSETPPDVQTLGAFHQLLVRFYEEADIDDLWRKLQPRFEQEIARYHEPVSRAVLEVNAYLRNPTSGYMGRRFQIYVDLLAPPNQVHTRSYGDEYFIVVTPSAEPRIDDIRHAYLHYVLDPLATKYSERVMRVRGLGDFAEAAPALDEIYKSDFLLLTTESLIKAVEARLNKRPPDIQQAFAEGFVLAPYFSESLPAYEKQEAAMRLHFPDMLDAIDVRKEDRRIGQVKWAESKAVRKVAPAPARSAPAGNPAEQALETADKLYASRDLDKAREGYLGLVRQTDDKRIHSRAYYGLARIAALKNEAELAEQLFRKTLELSPDPHTRSWSEIYLGRLAEGYGERDRAAQHYQAALAVEGAPPGARQAAEQGLQKTRKP
jgi:tetratricopeptide (TPR) repeat protein